MYNMYPVYIHDVHTYMCTQHVNENDKLDSLLSSEETNNANYGSQPKDSENPYGSAPSLIDVVR